jgi:hypothetical protein
VETIPYSPMTLVDLAIHLQAASEDRRWLLVLEFLEECQWVPAQERESLIAVEPSLVDQDRWDVMLGALAEYVALKSDIATPAWSAMSHRVWCGRAWFLSELKSVRASALSTSPASFRARGIFLEPRDLTRDGLDLAGVRR